MRILQIGPVPPELGGATFGGVASHAWSLARHLARRGHHVAILADNLRPGAPAPAAAAGVRLYGVAGAALAGIAELCRRSTWQDVRRTKEHVGALAGWRAVVSAVAGYRHVLRQFTPDLIHVHHLELRFPPAYYGRPKPIPIVSTIHSTHALDFGDPARQPALRRLWQRNLALSQYVLFVSDFVRRRVETLFPAALPASASGRTVPNPVEMDPGATVPCPAEAKAALGLPQEVPLGLFVGQLIARKGVDTLIEASRRLATEGLAFRVHIVGDGPERQRLGARVREAGLSEVVTFTGWKAREDLRSHYAAADVLILPSRMESFGLVFIEAMLCGCPVLGSPEVLSELLPNDAFGRRVPPADPAALAAAMREAFRQPRDRQRIRDFAATFAWEVRIEAYENIYRDMVERRAP